MIFHLSFQVLCILGQDRHPAGQWVIVVFLCEIIKLAKHPFTSSKPVQKSTWGSLGGVVQVSLIWDLVSNPWQGNPQSEHPWWKIIWYDIFGPQSKHPWWDFRWHEICSVIKTSFLKRRVDAILEAINDFHNLLNMDWTMVFEGSTYTKVMHWLIFCIQFGQFSTELQIFDKMRRWKIPETMRCIAFNQSLCKPWWLCLGRYDPTRAYWSTNKATKEKKYFGSSHEYFWL